MSAGLEQQLIGGWSLRRWEIVHADGTRTEPFGPDAAGLILYTADGWMSATIMAAGRRNLSRTNPRLAPAAERAAAFNGYFTYAGRWRVVGNSVHHEVAVALNPAMVGTVQVRAARVTAQTLTLSAVERVAGGERRHRIVWHRAKRGVAKPVARARKDAAR